MKVSPVLIAEMQNCGLIQPKKPIVLRYAMLILSLPPSTNELYVVENGKRVKSSKYKLWLQSAGTDAKIQGGNKTVSSPVRVKLVLCGKVHRMRDLDNFAKPILDLLVKVGTISADNLNHVREILLTCEKSEQPPTIRVEVERSP